MCITSFVYSTFASDSLILLFLSLTFILLCCEMFPSGLVHLSLVHPSSYPATRHEPGISFSRSFTFHTWAVHLHWSHGSTHLDSHPHLSLSLDIAVRLLKLLYPHSYIISEICLNAQILTSIINMYGCP